MAIHTETISIKGPNGALDGYFAAPDGGPAPAVVVIQEAFGVNEHIRNVTEKVAEAGYAALAPDLFWQVQPGFTSGYSAEEIEKARGLMANVDLDKAVLDVGAAMETLLARPESRGSGTGVVGFCWGGLMTYLVSCRLDPTCAVAYYGGRIASFIGEADNLNCPVMFHFGDQDASIPMDQVEQIRQAMSAKAEAPLFVYEGAQHGFNCNLRGSYHEEGAKQAWARTTEFFGKHLG